jgi:RNA polymerase-associated protein
MMILYAGTSCLFSHRCRIVLYEKGMDFEIKHIDAFERQEEVASLNPYGKLPILVERDLTLYESNIINEYIDERFPHPQLMPADPAMRARARLMLHNLENDLFSQVRELENPDNKYPDKTRALVRDSLAQIAPLFTRNRYMMGDEYTMLDVAIAPLLWRLGHYGIQLPRQAAPILKYAEMLFARPAFAEALTPVEKSMRK